MKNKSYNYKYIIGLIIGLLSITVVYAASTLSSDVYYDSSNSSLSSGDVQGAIDDLAEKIGSIQITDCPDGYYCEKYKTSVEEFELGDYVSYTPSSTSYTTDTTYTGYSSTQTINPSELNLWRVLNINDDGTVDLISEYVSSTAIYFSGQTGYLNLIGELNRLASEYETEGITVGSRHFGYNGQTEYITDISKFVNPAPWTASTSDNSNESVGGGDILYEKDYNQVKTALGTGVAYKVGSTTATPYWMASRYYHYSYSADYYWNGRFVATFGSSSYYRLYRYSSSSFAEINLNYGLRPIVTLKSGLSYGNGSGGVNSPIQIIS